tara:strand:- start:1208 stop:2458 length:1251 start_codon:yes stop_codon:yes gene_type:complete
MKKSKSNTFCPAPFTQLNFKNDNRIMPCCKIASMSPDSKVTARSIDEYWDSDELKNLRKNLFNDVKDPICSKCWDEETYRAGNTSLRKQQLARLGEKRINDLYETASRQLESNTVSKTLIKEIEMRFDNICNLQCRMCHPHFSHKWEADARTNPELSKLFATIPAPSSKNGIMSDETIQEIIQLVPNLEKIIISGGEAMYSRRHYEFLDQIKEDASHLTLFYPTNLTLLEYKSWKVVDLWKNFKKISIRVSIDGCTQDRYGYIRQGGILADVEKNIRELKTHKNIVVTSAITVSILNITQLTEIMEYLVSLGTTPQNVLVQYPVDLNIQVLPQGLKNEITQKWDDYLSGKDKDSPGYHNLIKQGQSIINYMNINDMSHKWNDAKEFCAIQDRHFNTNILDVIPEFTPYWQQNVKDD